MGRLDDVDLTQTLATKDYERLLSERGWRLAQLRLALGGKLGEGGLGPGLLVLFEGWDASGKGGAIKRLVAPLDARHVRVVQYAPRRRREAPLLPQPLHAAPARARRDGRLRPHLVRPRAGRAGRGLRATEQWQRAYAEIVDFERSLFVEGIIVVKFWIHISPRGAAAPVQGAREGSAEAVEAHRRGLAQPRALGRLRRRRRGDGRPHRHDVGAVAPDRR